MSHKPGAYLGGIRAVEDMRQRCLINEETGCWHWKLSTMNGIPSVHFVTPDTGKRVKTRGRRAALYLLCGHDVKPGWLVYATEKCHSLDCVNPVHCKAGSKETFGKMQARTGRAKTIAKTIAARKTAAKLRKMTWDQVREIRNSDESTVKLAERMGFSQYAIWAARKGITWKESVQSASVFTWRP